MDAETEFATLALSRDKEGLAWEERAKIIWGDSSDQVYEWLVQNGFDHFTADSIVQVCVRERARSMRVKGLRDLMIGLLLLCVAVGLAIGLCVLMFGGGVGVRLPAKLFGLGIVGSVLAGIKGLNLTWRGFERLLGGARASGAVSDVEEQ